MTHESEIDKKINDEYEVLRNGPYTGSIPPPENLIDLFKKALMEVPFGYHNLNMVKVREIIEKNNVRELTLMEVGIVTNMIKTVAPKVIFSNPYKLCEYVIGSSAFAEEYNKIIADIEKKIQAKKGNLKNTSGIIRNVNKTTIGGGRIISAHK